MIVIRTSDGHCFSISVQSRRECRREFTTPELHSIKHVTVDGEDLDYVRKCMGLPVPLAREHVTWFGDDAKYLIANL